jgi:transposase InsO family protein
MPSLAQEAVIIERFRIVEYADQESVTAAARHFACSRTTVHKLRRAYQEGGLLALANRPRGPREPIPEEVVELVVALKTSSPHRSSTKVQQLLEERHGIRLSRQSVWRLLSARGLARVIDPAPLVRFERPLPNQLWQMDLKEKVSFPFGRAHLLVAIDDASRYCVGGRWIPDKREPSVLGALATILEQAGLPEAMLTDRDRVFFGPATRQRGLTTYQLALEALGVEPSFAKPYKPRTKGKIEKFIQTLERDFLWETKGQFHSLPELQRAWEQWREYYNRRRPHASLGELPPAHRYTYSRHAAPAELRQLLAVEERRLVHRDATIQLAGRRLPVPPELMGKHVWVRRLGQDILIEDAGRIVATYTT